MPKSGDTLFNVESGKLVKAYFVEEGLANWDCATPTFLLRTPRTREDYQHGRSGLIRCSTTMYVDTERKAWERYLAEQQAAITSTKKHLEEIKRDLAQCKIEILRVEKILDTIKETT